MEPCSELSNHSSPKMRRCNARCASRHGERLTTRGRRFWLFSQRSLINQREMNAPAEPPALPPLISEAPALGQPASRPRWWVHLLLLAGYPLVLGALGLLATEQKGPALGRGGQALLVVSAVELGCFGVVFGLAWLASRATRDQLLLLWRGGLWPIPLGIGYSVAIRVFVGVAVALVAGLLLLTGVMNLASLETFFAANRPKVETLIDVSALRKDPLYFWLSVTVVSFVVGGLREELWRSGFLAGMRALWPNRFSSRLGQTLAVAAAAAIFGLGHLMQGLLTVGLTALLGFALGMIIIWHRSIWPAVIAHGLFDATSLALLPLVVEKLPAN